MLTMLAILGVAFCATTIALVGWGLAMPRARATARVREIGGYGFPVEAEPPPTVQRSPLRDALSEVGAAVFRRVGGGYEERLRAHLVTAGFYDTAPRLIAGAQILSALLSGAAIALLGVGSSAPGRVVAIVVMSALGWAVPWVFVFNRAMQRRRSIDRKVPDMIDMLVVTLEAGLGFAASMQAASVRTKGPLGEELRLTMQEQEMGLTMRDALHHTAERTGSRSMGSFVRAVTQGEALGVSIGTVMRNIAEEMRVRRRQEAEERAQKAPVKMLFPLIFLMFPALMIVILGPALFEITDVLSGL